MFGYIRFFLAYMVLLSHLDIKFLGYNIGVFAVVFFYILAGLVTSKVFISVAPKYCNQDKSSSIFNRFIDKIHINQTTLFFIKDRFLRIYPTFFFTLIVTIAFFLITSFLEPKFNLKNIIYHLTIIPLNYFFYIDLAVINAPIGLNFLIPPAWSLAAELQAYFLLILAIKFRRFGFVVAILSLFIFMIANLTLINSDIYGYRTVCGVFFIFYTGFLIYTKDYLKIAIFYSIMAIFLCYLIYKNQFGIFSIEIIFGYILGVLLILTHENYKIKLKFNEIFGSLSYSLFICHFLFIWLCQYLFGTQNLIIITTFCVAFGLINYYLIEKRVNKIRFMG